MARLKYFNIPALYSNDVGTIHIVEALESKRFLWWTTCRRVWVVLEICAGRIDSSTETFRYYDVLEVCSNVAAAMKEKKHREITL